MINPARTVGFCYFIIASVVLPFAACISIIQEEYNIIASRPLKLVCNIESTITNAVTIRTPDNSEAVSCTPTVVFPPNPASCSSPGSVYTGSINETANTVTVTANTLPGDVNGTWTCTHGSNFEPFDFPNPIPCFTTESLVLNPSSFPGNITKDSTAFSLSVIYSCINVDVTFKWILKAGTSHEYPSPSVTKDSSSCTDTATCTGVNAYTQIISSDAVFQFAKAQGLQGGYELTVEAHFSDGITALKSQSIVYFEFRQDITTVGISTTTTDEQSTTSPNPTTSTLELQTAERTDKTVPSTSLSETSNVTVSISTFSVNRGENMGQDHLHLILIIVVSSVCGVIVISVITVVIFYRYSNKSNKCNKGVESDKKKNYDKNEPKGGKRLKDKNQLSKSKNEYQFYDGRISQNNHAFELSDTVDTRQNQMTYMTNKRDFDQIITVPYNSARKINNRQFHGQTSFPGRKMLAFPQYDYNFSRSLRNQQDGFYSGGHHFNDRRTHSHYPYVQQ